MSAGIEYDSNTTQEHYSIMPQNANIMLNRSRIFWEDFQYFKGNVEKCEVTKYMNGISFGTQVEIIILRILKISPERLSRIFNNSFGDGLRQIFIILY